MQVQVAELAHSLSDQNLELLPDYHNRIQVLKDLAFIDSASIVNMKGRVACEVPVILKLDQYSRRTASYGIDS